jgi:chaperonin cofactor prefoldin
MGENPDTVMPLLRGTIHECDRILRNWSGEEKALFDLGNLLGDKDLDSYMDAAKERLETGVERIQDLSDKDEASNTTYAKLKIGLAKIAFSKVYITL